MLTILLLALPLLVLGSLASCLTGLGLAESWLNYSPRKTLVPAAQIVAAALHVGWALNAALRRSLLAVAVCWPICMWFCEAGLVGITGEERHFWPALIVEGVPLALALSVSNRSSWSDRLARWRRARTDIAVQLEIGHGLLPWLARCLRQFLVGSAKTPASDFHRLAASVADAEPRLKTHLSRLTAPESLRQCILAKATDLAAHAEESAAQRAIKLEERALGAAALCREECERLDISSRERNLLAAKCELMLLEIARR